MVQQLPVATNWFTIEPADEYGIHRIQEPNILEYGCGNMWLVQGSKYNLLVETGVGVASLRRFLESAIPGSIIAFSSVGYYDHAGGLNQFDVRMIHEADAYRVANPTHHNTVAKYYMREVFTALPHEGFDPTTYVMPPSEPTRLLADGDIIDLGDRTFEVLHLPGVTEGACALFENSTGILFTGEAFVWSETGVYDGEPESRSSDADRTAFRRSITRLFELPATMVYPGHRARKDAETMRAVIAKYLGGM